MVVKVARTITAPDQPHHRVSAECLLVNFDNLGMTCDNFDKYL
jgi:hypothetical protein